MKTKLPTLRVNSLLSRTTKLGSVTLCAGAIALSSHAQPTGSIFNPSDYTSLGSLSTTSGDVITIDTDSLSFSLSGSSTLNGTGEFVVSEGGGTQLSLFNFSDIDIAAGTTFNVTGNRGLVFSSLTNFAFNAVLSLDGGNAGSSKNKGTGAPGAEGGVRATSFGSNPQTNSNAGNGGTGSSSTASNNEGKGYGAGLGKGQYNPGAGASYGGEGGHGQDKTSGAGPTYGDEQLTELYGGSGGAGGTRTNNDTSNGGPGGGGGGALSFVALGNLNIAGQVSADGGNGRAGSTGSVARGGGGGSGGGILFAASTITLTSDAVISATGGTIRNSGKDGGAGGGGRIAIYGILTNNGTIDVSGGEGYAGGDGDAGTIYFDSNFVHGVPEPATYCYLAALCLGTWFMKRRLMKSEG